MTTSEFSEMVRTKRMQDYDTARDFYRRNSLSCTYAYYAQIEKSATPEIILVLEIIDKLKLNSRKALFAWARDKMPTSELKSYFTEIGDEPSLSSEQNTAGRSLVINRMQAAFLSEHPVYWEILVYFSCNFGKKIPTMKELAKIFSMHVPKMEKICRQLFDYCLLDKNNDGLYLSKEWMFIPYEEEFKSLRDKNFIRATEQFKKAATDTQFRTTVTTLLTPEKQKTLESKVLALTNDIIDLSEKEKSKDAIPYTIGVFSSPRIFGNDD